MPQLALRAVPMAGMDVMARSWWRCQQFSTLMMLMFVWSLQPFEIFWALLSTESTESTGVCELHRRLPGDVTLPNDTRFIDWVAVVYSCWADLAGGSGDQMGIRDLSFLCNSLSSCPMLSHVVPWVSIEAVVWHSVRFWDRKFIYQQVRQVANGWAMNCCLRLLKMDLEMCARLLVHSCMHMCA